MKIFSTRGFLLGLLLFCAGGSRGYAEHLNFAPGLTASYLISQQAHVHLENLEGSTHVTTDNSMLIDLKLLSVGPQSGYPFEVEVQIRELNLFKKWTKDSILVIRSNEKKLKELPTLYFFVTGEYQVQETSGKLARLSPRRLPDEPNLGDFGCTPATFKLLLTQIFHLAGKELTTETTYPVDCARLLDWEDETFLGEGAWDIEQKSAYTLESLGSAKAIAQWRGNAKVYDPNSGSMGHVAVATDVQLSLANGLEQKRDLQAIIEQTRKPTSSHLTLEIKQQWRPLLEELN